VRGNWLSAAPSAATSHAAGIWAASTQPATPERIGEPLRWPHRRGEPGLRLGDGPAVPRFPAPTSTAPTWTPQCVSPAPPGSPTPARAPVPRRGGTRWTAHRKSTPVGRAGRRPAGARGPWRKAGMKVVSPAPEARRALASLAPQRVCQAAAKQRGHETRTRPRGGNINNCDDYESASINWDAPTPLETDGCLRRTRSGHKGASHSPFTPPDAAGHGHSK